MERPERGRSIRGTGETTHKGDAESGEPSRSHVALTRGMRYGLKVSGGVESRNADWRKVGYASLKHSSQVCEYTGGRCGSGATLFSVQV
jgi:hypothetical protein